MNYILSQMNATDALTVDNVPWSLCDALTIHGTSLGLPTLLIQVPPTK
jgi:hypothetical protein